MNISSVQAARAEPSTPTTNGVSGNDNARQTFNNILGELLFNELVKSMRQTVDEPAYFHGGRAEEMFTSRLDQLLSQEMGEAHGEQYFGPMYDAWANR